MLGVGGRIHGGHLQVECIQFGLLDFKPGQGCQHRPIGLFDLDQPPVAVLLFLADEPVFMFIHKGQGLVQIAEGPPRHENAHQIRGAQQVLGVGFLEMARGPDHQGLSHALFRLALVEHKQAGRYAVAVKELSGQHHDALDQVSLHKAAPD